MIGCKRVSLLAVLMCFVFSPAVVAQPRNSTENTRGIVISGSTGISVLNTDVFQDFSDLVQFNNQPGSYTGFEVSRFFTSALEAGAGFSWSGLEGNAETIDLAVLWDYFNIEQPMNGKVIYNIRLNGPELFVRYHFGRNIHEARSFDFFIKAGAGIMFYELELFFSDKVINELIFGNEFKLDKSSNIVYTLGAGFSYGLTEMVRLKIAAGVNRMHFDIPDVVQNFDLTGDLESVPGVFTNFSAGVIVKLNQQYRKNKNPHFPFAP